MCPATRVLLLAAAVLCGSCSSSTEAELVDLTGFWSGTTTYSTDPSCAVLSCSFDSRMMIVQSGTSVEGWYRARAGIPGDQTAFVGSVQGDTLSVLINSDQILLVGATKFRILQDGRSLQAINNGNTPQFTLEE